MDNAQRKGYTLVGADESCGRWMYTCVGVKSTMPTTVYDADVSGSGSATIATTQVLFVSVDLTTLGMNPRPVDDDDHVIRAGWFALCDSFDIGLGTFMYCRAPIWVDFVHTLWTPDPSSIYNGATLILNATSIRWHFAVGVAAHLHVFG